MRMAVTHTQESERIGIGEAAAIVQLHPDTIRRAIKAGTLPFAYVKTPGGQYRFPRAAVQAYAAALTPSGDAA